jgi:hypothetical protein
MADSKEQPSTGRPKPPNAGKGRKKGVPNKVTREVREVLKLGIEGTADEMIAALRELLATEPSAGVRAWAAVAEFVLPKLGRTEVTGEDGGPVEFVIKDLGKGE